MKKKIPIVERLPSIPCGTTHVDKKDKRIKKFDYKNELKHY